MPLSASTAFTIVDAGTESESTSVVVLPLSANSLGTGRLVHPDLGVLDYPYPPDVWENFDTDVIYPPVWAVSPTMGGGAVSVWPGYESDPVVVERWVSDASMPMPFVRTLLGFYTNPPAPEDGYIEWYPSYANELGYRVVILSVTCGGEGVRFDFLTRQGWLAGELAVQMKVVGRV